MNAAWNVMGRDQINVRSVYPRATGSTAGQRAGAQNPQTNGASSEKIANAGAANVAKAASGVRGPLGQPVTWWIVLLAALFGLMVFAQRVGDDSDFGNIKASVYNVVIISLSAIIGIGFFKVLFTRIHVPGLSDLVSAV